MMDRPDKKKRKEMLAQVRAKQRAEARSTLPLPAGQMRHLFDMLDQELPRRGCDHTLRITEEWLRDERLEVEGVLNWLRTNGGYCDCEALLNAEEQFQDCMHDVDC